MTGGFDLQRGLRPRTSFRSLAARLSGNCLFLPSEAHQVSDRWALLPHTSLARIEMQMRFSGIEEQVNAWEWFSEIVRLLCWTFSVVAYDFSRNVCMASGNTEVAMCKVSG